MKNSSPATSIIWTPELAYIIGLLVTDGNLSKDGRHIIMRSSDKDLLQTFSKCLNLSNKIAISTNNGYAKKDSFRIQFGNIRLYHFLLEIGLFPNKTYTIGAVKIPDAYFRDFLRGHLDGDGTILYYRDGYNYYRGRQYYNLRLFVKFISASQQHAQWLYTAINRLTELKGSMSVSRPRENRVPIWTIKYAKRESLRLLAWLYYKQDLPCLQRKMFLANDVMKAIVTEKRKVYTKVNV